jgi:hypothetical protein
MSHFRWTQRIAILTLILFLWGQQAYCQTVTTARAPASLATSNSANTAVTHGSSARSSPVNLDLTSVSATLSAGNLVKSGQVNIHVGNIVRSVTGSSMLTPSELLAVYQVLSSGCQKIVLCNAGNAVGGSLNIGSQFSNYVTSLVIPQGVTAIHDVVNSAGLNLSGNLTNFGILFAVSTNPAVTAASISATNIFNNQGALLTTVVPANGLAGYPKVVNNLSLNLNAVNNIVNSGVISSAGSLTVVAGGAINNALPSRSALAGVTMGGMAQMVAAENINLVTGTGKLVNSGLIQAVNSVNIQTSSLLCDLSINNTNGVIKALGVLSPATGQLDGGVINLREPGFNGAGNIVLIGGDWESQSLNFNSGHGAVTASVGNISGTVNVEATAANILASTPTLTLGNTAVCGDPTYVNAKGDIQLVGTVTESEDLAIIASGNITSKGAAQIVDNGHNVWLIAGGNVKVADGAYAGCGNSGTSLTLPPGTASEIRSGYVQVSATGGTGGDIDLQTGNTLTAGNTVIDTSSTVAGASGGKVNLVAIANGSIGGHVLFPTTDGITSINSSGLGNGGNGSVIIFAGAPGNQGISVGGIKMNGGTGATGILSINSAQATFLGGTGVNSNLIMTTDGIVEAEANCASCISFDSTGTATGRIYLPPHLQNLANPLATVTLAGPITVGNSSNIAINGTGVTILSTISMGNRGEISVGSTTEGINLQGLINAPGGIISLTSTAGGISIPGDGVINASGGSIFLTSTTGSISIPGTGVINASGGDISVSSTSGNISIPNAGGINGTGGNIFLSSTSGNINMFGAGAIDATDGSFSIRIPGGHTGGASTWSESKTTVAPIMSNVAHGMTATVVIREESVSSASSVPTRAVPESPAILLQTVEFLPSTTIIPTDQTPVSQQATVKVGFVRKDEGSPSGHESIPVALAFTADSKALLAQAVQASPGYSADRVRLESGNVLFIARKKIILLTDFGEILINRGNIVLVMTGQNSICAYNLHDNVANSPSAVCAGNSIRFGVGREILLKRETSKRFDRKIAHRHPEVLVRTNETEIQGAEFSLPSAIFTVLPVRAMRRSDEPDARRAMDQILKNAAILSLVCTRFGPYSGSSSER